jgi:hypothetical protein
MTRANYNRNDIEQILSLARIYNSTIGSYDDHAIDSNDFNYLVKLKNGKIKIFWEELQDKNHLTAERLQAIAARFQKTPIIDNSTEK